MTDIPNGKPVTLSVENTKRNRTVLENSPLISKFSPQLEIVEAEEAIRLTVAEKDYHRFSNVLLQSGMNHRTIV